METQNVSLMPQRIESLDALRGLDLFFLVAFGPFARTLIKAAELPCLDGLYKQLSHVQWEGFAVWDLIMPLFLFMSGITIPFAFSRMKQERDKRALIRRLTKRVLLLWIFGMIVQGNLLGLDPDHIYFYTNTLQTIAVGYLASALFFFFYFDTDADSVHCRPVAGLLGSNAMDYDRRIWRRRLHARGKLGRRNRPDSDGTFP